MGNTTRITCSLNRDEAKHLSITKAENNPLICGACGQEISKHPAQVSRFTPRENVCRRTIEDLRREKLMRKVISKVTYEGRTETSIHYICSCCTQYIGSHAARESQINPPPEYNEPAIRAPPEYVEQPPEQPPEQQPPDYNQ